MIVELADPKCDPEEVFKAYRLWNSPVRINRDDSGTSDLRPVQRGFTLANLMVWILTQTDPKRFITLHHLKQNRPECAELARAYINIWIKLNLIEKVTGLDPNTFNDPLDWYVMK